MFVHDAVDPNDPIFIKVEEFVQFQEYGNVNGTNTKVGINKSHTVLEFQVRGQDGSYGGVNKNPDGLPLGGGDPEPAAFVYYGDGMFYACRVIAPYGTVGFGGHQTYGTQVIGQSFRHVNNIAMSFQAAPSACFDMGALAGSACIDDFDVIPENGLTGEGLNLEVRGVNLAQDSFRRLGIFISTTILDLNNMPDMGDAGADQLTHELVFINDKQFNTQDDASGDSLCEQINNASGPGILHSGIDRKRRHRLGTGNQ